MAVCGSVNRGLCEEDSGRCAWEACEADDGVRSPVQRGSERWARIASASVRMRGGFLAAALALLIGVHAAGDRVRLRDVQVGCAGAFLARRPSPMILTSPRARTSRRSRSIQTR